MAWLGGSFCFGVFLTYFLLGIGLSQVINWLTGHVWVKAGVYSVMGAGGLILGVLHARDAWRFRRSGCARDMEMGLVVGHHAENLNRRYLCAKFTWTRFLVPAGLALGFLISSLELVCTGQIYLPTLVLMNAVGNDHENPCWPCWPTMWRSSCPWCWSPCWRPPESQAQSLAGWARKPRGLQQAQTMSVLFFLLGALIAGHGRRMVHDPHFVLSTEGLGTAFPQKGVPNIQPAESVMHPTMRPELDKRGGGGTLSRLGYADVARQLSNEDTSSFMKSLIVYLLLGGVFFWRCPRPLPPKCRRRTVPVLAATHSCAAAACPEAAPFKIPPNGIVVAPGLLNMGKIAGFRGTEDSVRIDQF